MTSSDGHDSMQAENIAKPCPEHAATKLLFKADGTSATWTAATLLSVRRPDDSTVLARVRPAGFVACEVDLAGCAWGLQMPSGGTPQPPGATVSGAPAAAVPTAEIATHQPNTTAVPPVGAQSPAAIATPLPAAEQPPQATASDQPAAADCRHLLAQPHQSVPGTLQRPFVSPTAGANGHSWLAGHEHSAVHAAADKNTSLAPAAPARSSKGSTGTLISASFGDASLANGSAAGPASSHGAPATAAALLHPASIASPGLQRGEVAEPCAHKSCPLGALQQPLGVGVMMSGEAPGPSKTFTAPEFKGAVSAAEPSGPVKGEAGACAANDVGSTPRSSGAGPVATRTQQVGFVDMCSSSDEGADAEAAGELLRA